MQKWLVAWDFSQRPKTTFYEIYRDEFADIERIQRSVAICPDDFTARRLRALLRFYGAEVIAYAVNGARLDDAVEDREAEAFVARIQQGRLSRRGRHPNRKRKP